MSKANENTTRFRQAQPDRIRGDARPKYLLPAVKNFTFNEFYNMKKYLHTTLYYLVGIVVIYLVNMVSPNQHDGGLGLGSLLLILFVLASIILLLINMFKGFKNNEYLIIAGIHLLALLIMAITFFL